MILSVIIPAHNEASLIGPCLLALITGQDGEAGPVFEIIVVANACEDSTAENARQMSDFARKANIGLSVLETPVSGKANALNLAEQVCKANMRVYLDADVICSPGMIAELAKILSVTEARYASGQVLPCSGGNFVSECYGHVWGNLPFVADGVAGCGLYAVNATGRLRWDKFPEIHSDDKFVRLHFTQDERFKVDVNYLWPLPKSLRGLIAVRSRWCRGNSEFARDYKHLLINEHSQSIDARWALVFGLKHPLSCIVFVGVYIAAKLRALIYSNSATSGWERSR